VAAKLNPRFGHVHGPFARGVVLVLLAIGGHAQTSAHTTVAASCSLQDRLVVVLDPDLAAHTEAARTYHRRNVGPRRIFTYFCLLVKIVSGARPHDHDVRSMNVH
jgi:hypothetical protein